MRSANERRFVMDLDWNLLRTFVVIVEEGGITSAADRLLLSQPTVSLALKRLESHVDARLIDRGGGVFRVTAAGQALFREAIDVFESVSRLQGAIRESTRGLSGLVRIALATHIVTPLLDETLAGFCRNHPDVTYRIAVGSSSSVSQAVLNDEASLGICLVSNRLRRLEYRMMYREFFGFYCGPSHPLFGRAGISISALRGYPLVSFDTDDAGDALHAIARLRQRHALDQPIVGYSNNLEEVRRMIVNGLGFGPLPVHVAARDVADGTLWRLPPLRNPPAVDIFLLTNPEVRRNRAETAFIGALFDAIDTTPLADRTYHAAPNA